MVFLEALVLLAGFSTSFATPVTNNDFFNAPPDAVQRRDNSSGCTFEFFDQQIDHFGQHNGTFKQRYNLITEFFKPGGPILFFQGEESTELDCVVRSTIPKITEA